MRHPPDAIDDINADAILSRYSIVSADHHTAKESNDCFILSSELSNFDQTTLCLLGILSVPCLVSSASSNGNI
jgi:hypothetical protein